jgi:uncharacterized protein YutE (UPF0331/DUF86 family)
VVKVDLVSAKLAEIEDRLARVRAHRGASAEQLREDRDAFDLVSFNLMLAVQACCDVAAHLIADERWPAAPTLAASFARLQTAGVLTTPTAAALARAVGLRNAVAHGYSSVNPEAVFAASTVGVADVEAFVREVAGWVTAAR